MSKNILTLPLELQEKILDNLGINEFFNLSLSNKYFKIIIFYRLFKYNTWVKEYDNTDIKLLNDINIYNVLKLDSFLTIHSSTFISGKITLHGEMFIRDNKNIYLNNDVKLIFEYSFYSRNVILNKTLIMNCSFKYGTKDGIYHVLIYKSKELDGVNIVTNVCIERYKNDNVIGWSMFIDNKYIKIYYIQDEIKIEESFPTRLYEIPSYLHISDFSLEHFFVKYPKLYYNKDIDLMDIEKEYTLNKNYNLYLYKHQNYFDITMMKNGDIKLNSFMKILFSNNIEYKFLVYEYILSDPVETERTDFPLNLSSEDGIHLIRKFVKEMIVYIDANNTIHFIYLYNKMKDVYEKITIGDTFSIVVTDKIGKLYLL